MSTNTHVTMINFRRNVQDYLPLQMFTWLRWSWWCLCRCSSEIC